MKERIFYVVVSYTKTGPSQLTTVGRGGYWTKIRIDKLGTEFVKTLHKEAVTLYGTDQVTILNWIELETE